MPDARSNTSSADSNRTSVALWKKRFSDPFAKPSQALLLCGFDADTLRTAAEDCAQAALGTPLAHHPDFLRITPEKNAIKIEAVRELIARLALKPFQGQRLVVLLEDADFLTDSAANALLKTLEEPSAATVFLLTTRRPEEVLTTIRSRCQRLVLATAPEALSRNFEASYESWEEELAPLFAQGAKPFATASLLAESLSSQNDRLPDLFETLKALWRDLSILSVSSGQPSVGVSLIPRAQARLAKLAERKAPETVFEDVDLILETERAIEGNVNKTLALERLFSQLLQ